MKEERRVYFKIEDEQERKITEDEFYTLSKIVFPFKVTYIIKD